MRLTEPGQDFELQFCRECGCEYYGEPDGCNHPNYVCASNCYFTTVAERLQEYEDLEEQGQLLKLPCKAGDTVYYISDTRKKGRTIIPAEVHEAVVDHFTVGDYGKLIMTVCDAENVWIAFFDCDIGTAVFLSRKDAEAVVKGAER